MITQLNLLARCLVAALLLLFLFNGAQAQVVAGTAQTRSNAARPIDPPPEEEPPPYNYSAFSSQSVPTTMTAGTAYTVTVSMYNNGTTTWSSNALHALGSYNPMDNSTWGGGRVGMAGDVAPGQTATFTFQVTAPSTPGNYNFQWRMVQDGVEWFGGTSTNVVVNVVAAPRNDAIFTGQSVPSTMNAGAAYQVSVSMYNNGNTTWTTSDPFALGALNPHHNETWGTSRGWLASNVAPGQSVTFTFQVRAPSVPGSYNFQWGMLQSSCCWFGAESPNVVVNVVAPQQNGAQVIGMTVPPLTTGQGANISVTMQNTGSTTWPAGSNYKLGSQNPGENTIWGVQRVDLSNDVAPGQSYTFTFSITAPAAGTYTMQWQMMQRYVEWFGAIASAGVAVNAAPSGDTVTYIHTDALGSPVARSDSAGNVISRTQYEPYGRTASGATPTIGFTGHVNDADTGLVYMQQRYYDPVAGRFLSVDPVTTDASTGGNFNRYAYANNSPYKYVDPDGRNWALAGRGAILGAELGSVAGPWGAAAGAIIVGGGTLWLGDKAIKWIASSSNADSSKASPNTTSEGKSDSKSGSNGAGNNPYKGPATEPVTVVDQHGNAIPVDQGQRINTSPNGDFQQVIGADGKPTGDRLDRGGHPGQRDPSAQKPHGHRPGVTTPDGNPHLPIKPEVN